MRKEKEDVYNIWKMVHILLGASIVFFDIVLVFASFSEGATLTCESCKENFCSSVTNLGFVSGTKSYSFDVTVSCFECANHVLRVALDDARGKRYIKEEKIARDGSITHKVNVHNFTLSDGYISFFFEVSATGPEGYRVISSLSCQIIYDDHPEPPSGVFAIPRESSFLVGWNKHIDRDISKFRLYLGFPPSCSSDFIETTSYEVEVTSIKGERVRNGERYCGFVQAIDNSGNVSEASEFFYVIPARTFKFAEGEEIGCIIYKVFGESYITKLLRKVRNMLLKLPGGFFFVRTYYRFSSGVLHLHRKIVEAVSILFHFPKDLYAHQETNLDCKETDYDHIVLLGGGITSFKRLGVLGGRSVFELIYGRKIILADILIGRRVTPFLPIFLAARTNPSILQGKRVIFSEAGELVRTAEPYSTLIMVPTGVGIELFLDLVEEQILVPSIGAYFGGFLIFEDYPDGSKFGAVFGPSFSFGGNLLLDMFDRRSEAIAKSEYGIENFYIFVRGTVFYVNLIRKGVLSFRRTTYFDFSSSYISAGVAFVY